MIRILDKTQRKDAFAFLEKCLTEDITTSKFSKKIISRLQKEQDAYTWVADLEENRIQGILLYDIGFRINFLYVNKEVRNRGIGTALVRECVKGADRGSVSRIRIHSVATLSTFLEDFGFETFHDTYTGQDEMEYLCGMYLLGKTVTVKVERTYGSLDLRSEGELSVNCGYIEEEVTMDDTFIKDAYIVGVHEPLESFTGVVIALLYHEEDDLIRAVVGRQGEVIDHEQVIQEIGMVEQYYNARIVFADTRS